MPATMMLKEIVNYPVDERVMMADAIIESLNGTDPAVEALWTAVAKSRLSSLRTGQVKGVSAARVFARARALCNA